MTKAGIFIAFGMVEHLLYLTTTGRTAGEPRSIDIRFADHAGRQLLERRPRLQCSRLDERAGRLLDHHA
jgi:hypothetical protein